MQTPQLLKHALEDSPSCLFCEKDLHQSGEPYMAEAAFRQYPDRGVVDVVYQYCICMSCYEAQKQGISDESMQVMQSFFQQRVDLSAMAIKADPKYGLVHCAVSGKSATEMESFQIGALLRLGELESGYAPMLFDESVMDELMLLLSDSTREYLDGFKDKLPTIPPEFEDLFKDRPLVFI
jgi:hypothetical protein